MDALRQGQHGTTKPLLLNQGYFVGCAVGEATELVSKLLRMLRVPRQCEHVADPAGGARDHPTVTRVAGVAESRGVSRRAPTMTALPAALTSIVVRWPRPARRSWLSASTGTSSSLASVFSPRGSRPPNHY